MPYYPVFLDLKGKKCVVVGGGRVARRKVASLMGAGAEVAVIAPEITPSLSREKDKGKITHIPRAYRRGDLKGAFLAISATDSEEENMKVAREARHLNIPVNVVDRPALCSFIVPSTVKRGPLVIAVSTSGASPAMSRAIRLELERLYGKRFGTYLERLAALREKALKELPPEARRRLFKKLASSDIIQTIREGGGVPAAKKASVSPGKTARKGKAPIKSRKAGKY